MDIHDFMETYAEELNDYKCDFKLPGGIVLHIAPVGETGYYVGTLTGYNKEGQKSADAIPSDIWLNLINDIEQLIKPLATKPFTGKLVGHKAIGSNVISFLLKKQVHRFFFLEEQNMLKFLKSYNHYSRSERRRNSGITIITVFGN